MLLIGVVNVGFSVGGLLYFLKNTLEIKLFFYLISFTFDEGEGEGGVTDG
jgi:hypothetical protein